MWPFDAEETMRKVRQEEFGPPWTAETTGFENPGGFPPGDIRNTRRRHCAIPSLLTDEEVGDVFGHAWPELRSAQLIEVDRQVRDCTWSLIGPNWMTDRAKSWKEPFLDHLTEAERLEASRVKKLGLRVGQERKRLREAEENCRQANLKAKRGMNQEMDDIIRTGSDHIEQCSQTKAFWLRGRGRIRRSNE